MRLSVAPLLAFLALIAQAAPGESAGETGHGPLSPAPSLLQPPSSSLQETPAAYEIPGPFRLQEHAGVITPVHQPSINSIQDTGAGKTLRLAIAKTLREGRRLKGGLLRRLALPLLILLGIKAGLGLPILFGGVALAAFKGLWTGSMALLMTAAHTLKNLIPPPKVIVAAHGAHAHVSDYLADYKRADDYYKDDYNRYNYGWN